MFHISLFLYQHKTKYVGFLKMMKVQRKYVLGSSLIYSKLKKHVATSIDRPSYIAAAKCVDKESCFFQFNEFFRKNIAPISHFRILGIALELACNGGSCGGISLKRDRCNLHLKRLPRISLTCKLQSCSPIPGIRKWPIVNILLGLRILLIVICLSLIFCLVSLIIDRF